MPQAKKFKKGSIIYFDGEAKNHYVYLLKSGVCSRTKFSVETQIPERTKLIVGEFFGIKTALGVPLRDETISVLSDAVVYIFTPAEFDAIIKKNVSIIFKMLKAFSNELRRIHHAIENILILDAQEGSLSTGGKLFSIGEYYQKNKKFTQAKYAFTKFIEHYPHNEKVKDAKEYLSRLEEFITGNVSEMDGDGEGDGRDYVIAENDFQLMETEESYEPEQITDQLSKKFSQLSASYAIKDFTEAWLISEELHEELADAAQEGQLFEKINLARTRLLFYKGAFDMCIEEAKSYIKKFKNSAWSLDIMLCIAESYIKLGRPENARAVFNKIIDNAKAVGNTALESTVTEKLGML